jgi:pimeloyl-ACP methyl ester carboxylesterase
MVRRHLRVPAAALLMLMSAGLVLSCGDSTTDKVSDTSETSNSNDGVHSAPATTAPDVTSTMAVPGTNSQVLALVDTSRPVVSNGRTISSTRSLPTTVWRPNREGIFPLVVFAHGYRLGPPGYARFCAMLSDAGYIVAAPSFPLADESRGNGLNRDDIPNEAKDVSFVIAALRASALAPVIASGPVGVAGHSDGADVALIIGYQQGYADAAVGSVVAVAPDAFTGQLSTNRPPLLLVHADADATVPYSESVQVFARVPGQRTFLTLIGADHLPPIDGNTVWTPVLDGAVVTFFDATLKHVQTLESARTLMATLGRSKLQVGS